MNKELFEQLYHQWRSESMTEAAWQQFREAVTDPQYQSWLEEIVEADLHHPEFDNILSEAENHAAFLRLMEAAAPVRRVHFMRRWWAVAAAVLLLCAGTYLWLYQPEHTPPQVAQVSDVQPGREGAILTLADGSKVSLDTISQGVVALQGGAVAKVANGKLMYDGKGNEVVYNTMTIPKGRQFQLTLPDGTRVWLNNASSIRYPTGFTGQERKVEITGEAYFEVAQQAQMPFRVIVNNKATIEVLGTHFNVNAYDNEASMNTTLLEGAVRVTSARRSVILKLGQQAQVKNLADEIKVISNIDEEKVIAWKDGYFNFTGLTFEEVTRQLERWYDVEVVFEKGAPKKRFGGKMTKDVPLSAVMKYLEGIGIHCQLQDRKLIILP